MRFGKFKAKKQIVHYLYSLHFDGRVGGGLDPIPADSETRGPPERTSGPTHRDASTLIRNLHVFGLWEQNPHRHVKDMHTQAEVSNWEPSRLEATVLTTAP